MLLYKSPREEQNLSVYLDGLRGKKRPPPPDNVSVDDGACRYKYSVKSKQESRRPHFVNLHSARINNDRSLSASVNRERRCARLNNQLVCKKRSI